MTTYAQIEGGVVTNTIVGDPTWLEEGGAVPEGLVLVPEGSLAGIGWVYDGGTFHPPEEPPAPPTVSISRRAGLITLFREEGVKDTDIQSIIDGIDDPLQQYEAQQEFNSAVWEIDNPHVVQFGAALGLSAERLQELFNIASSV